jgi:hypothetical protein
VELSFHAGTNREKAGLLDMMRDKRRMNGSSNERFSFDHTVSAPSAGQSTLPLRALQVNVAAQSCEANDFPATNVV